MKQLGAALLAMLALACASTPARTEPVSPPVVAATPAPTPTPVAVPTPAPSASPAEVPVYRVGSGDVLDVAVIGNPDLSRTVTVQNDGSIFLPLVLEVPVAGQTLVEIEERLTRELGDKYLVDPQIDVQVREYNSQFVTVLGEVNQPGRRPLRGGTRLIDVLLEAGGLRATASGEIVVTRPGGFEDGTASRRGRFTPGRFGASEQVILELPLRAGDIVTANPKAFVTMQGEIVRPNRYQVDVDLTVTGLVSLAGGLTRFGSSKIEILRRDATGATTRLEADLKAIREGREPDLTVQSGDIVTVPRRLF